MKIIYIFVENYSLWTFLTNDYNNDINIEKKIICLKLKLKWLIHKKIKTMVFIWKLSANYYPVLKSIKLFTFHHPVPKFTSSQETGRLCGRWTWKTCRIWRVWCSFLCVNRTSRQKCGGWWQRTWRSCSHPGCRDPFLWSWRSWRGHPILVFVEITVYEAWSNDYNNDIKSNIS